MRLSRQNFGRSFQPPWITNPHFCWGHLCKESSRTESGRYWMPLISDPFRKQRGERNRAGPCGCQAIFSRSAWSLRGCGGHISRPCGQQSWLGKSGCSFWGYFATQNVSHAVGATDLDLLPLLLTSMGANSCLQSQPFTTVC